MITMVAEGSTTEPFEHDDAPGVVVSLRGPGRVVATIDRSREGASS
jgi:hypothetical protein